MNRGFADGNKRVALACTKVFLKMNGMLVSAENAKCIAFICHHLDAGTFNKDNLDVWLRLKTKPV